jgi:hypothetical protein
MAIDGAQPPADELALCAGATLAAPSARLACELSVRRDSMPALTVWVDGEYVRRIRTTDRAARKVGREQVTLAVTKELTTDLLDLPEKRNR